MHTIQKLASTLALAGVAVIAAGARADAADDYIKLADGTRLKGDATAYDDTMKTLSFRTEDGRDMIFRLDELDQRSVYQVTRSKVEKTNGKGQLQLANFARDIGLYAHAARHYRYAREADPSLAAEVDRELAVGKRMAADWCVANARAAADKGDLKEAEKWLKLLIEKLPDEPQAAAAQAALAEYYAKNHEAQDDHLEDKGSSLLANELKAGKQAYDKMIADTQKGLTTTPPGSKSVNAFESAIKQGQRALKEIEKVEKKTDDPGTLEITKGYRKLVNDHLIDVHLSLANHWATRTSYDKATGETNQALAIDPKNGAALAMRARIVEASSRGGRWIW